MLHHALRASLAPKTIPTISYRASYSSTSNLTTYTFNNCDIGTATNTRLVVITIQGLSSNSILTRTVSSATINSVSASSVVNTSRISLNSIFAASVSSGTSVTISITASGGLNNCLIGVYALDGLLSTTQRTTASLATSAGGDPSISASINGLANAVIIAAAATSTNSTATWTGVNENYDTTVESDLRTAGSIQLVETDSTYDISCAFSPDGIGSLSVAAWR